MTAPSHRAGGVPGQASGATPSSAPRPTRRVVVSLLLLVPAALVLAALLLLPEFAARQLEALGCSATEIRWSMEGLTLSAVTCPDLQLRKTSFSLHGTNIHVLIDGARADLLGLAQRLLGTHENEPGPLAAAMPGQGPLHTSLGQVLADGIPLARYCRVTNLDLLAGRTPLAKGLSGTLKPLELSSPGTEISERSGILYLNSNMPVPWEQASGTISLQAELNTTNLDLQARMHAPSLGISHPVLARRPFQVGPVGLDLAGNIASCMAGESSLSRHGVPCAFTGVLKVGTIHATIHVLWGPEGQDSPAPRSAGPDDAASRESEPLAAPQASTADYAPSLPGSPRNLVLEIPEGPLASLLEPMKPLLPELAGARVEGSAGLKLEWSHDKPLEVDITLSHLGVTGAIPPGTDLEWGPFTYQVTDSQGTSHPRRSGEGTPDWTPLARVSMHLSHAVLAAEDSSFFNHQGYDATAIQEALQADLREGEILRGASTITQQLAKNLFLDGRQTLARKLRELLLAVEMDRSLGKNRVLELYLNVVEWGPDIWGIGAASERYFLKQPQALDPLESAFLAAMLPNPRKYHDSWYLADRPPRRRMAAILDNMVDAGWLGRRSAERWKQSTLLLVPPPRENKR